VVGQFVLLFDFVIVSFYVPVVAAPPANPDIPSDLLREKLLSTYVNQMFQRAKYWRSDICRASSVDGIFAVREEINKDYNLYKVENYQKEYAKITEALYLPILQGKLNLIKSNDPLAVVKLINIALVISDMNPDYTARGFEEMLASPNQAICYIGWQGMKKSRNSETGASQFKILYTSAQSTLSKETNATILSEVMQAIDFGTAATQTVPEKYRKLAAGKTVELITQNWKKLTADVSAANAGEKLAVPAMAITTLANNATFTGDDKTKKQAIAMIYAQAQTAVARIEKLQAAAKTLKNRLDRLKASLEDRTSENMNQTANKNSSQELTPEQKKLSYKLDEAETLAGDYKVLMMNCEDAFNTLTGASNDFIAKQMTASADPAAAMKLGLLDWKSVLKPDAK